MVGYVVEVDAARVAYRERMLNQLRVVVTKEGTCVRILHPTQFLSDLQGIGRDPAIHAIGVADRFHRLFISLRRCDFPFGFGIGESSGEHSPVIILRGQEHEFGHGKFLRIVSFVHVKTRLMSAGFRFSDAANHYAPFRFRSSSTMRAFSTSTSASISARPSALPCSLPRSMPCSIPCFIASAFS